MPIDFCADRWNEIRQTYSQWWAGELDRPLVMIEDLEPPPGIEIPNIFDLGAPADTDSEPAG